MNFVLIIYCLYKNINSKKIYYGQFTVEIFENKPIIELSSNKYLININLNSIKIKEDDKIKILNFNNISIKNITYNNELRCIFFNLTTEPKTQIVINSYFFIDNGNIINPNNIINIKEGFLLINFTLTNDSYKNDSTFYIDLNIENSKVIKKIDNYTYEINSGLIYFIHYKKTPDLKDFNNITIESLNSSKLNAYIGFQVKNGEIILTFCDYFWIGIFLFIIFLLFLLFIYKIYCIISNQNNKNEENDEKSKKFLKI